MTSYTNFLTLPNLAGNCHVRSKGFVQDYRPLYQEGDIHIAPLALGAGVANTVRTPVAFGLPTIATPLSGKGGAGAVNLLIRDRADFASAVVELANDSAAFVYLPANDDCGWPTARRNLNDLLGRRIAGRLAA